MDWSDYDAALFDLDGVVTPTADVHRRAWTQMFDEFLASRGVSEPYTEDDYHRYVDGKPRFDGVRSFLASRDITVPEGSAADGPGELTVGGLGNRKNELFAQILDLEGVQAYPGSLLLIELLERLGVRRAIVSSSRNAPAVLAAAGIAQRFELVVDGRVAATEDLPGKPAPDTYQHAADRMGVPHRRAVVLEDALSGVAAGAAGDFGLVIGVDRGAGASALRAHGADLVVTDLAELT